MDFFDKIEELEQKVKYNIINKILDIRHYPK
jgi:hypothetical protein